MAEITIRELSNDCGRALDRVTGGEVLVVTRDGRGIAELRPLHPRPLSASVLLERWRRLPAVDPTRLRADIDASVEGAQ